MSDLEHLHDLISRRRSIKEFTDRRPTRPEIEVLLDTVVRAPNHRATRPWRFYVLGPLSRREWGAALGARKAKRVEDPDAAQAVIDKVAERHAALPAMIVVAIRQDENPEIREEDYAAAFMGIQNLSLAAEAQGLGSHLKTGAVMDDPLARAAVGLPEDERIVAIIELGEPAKQPDARESPDPTDVTTWVP